MQKRGCVIDSDDFNALTSTYPEHPLTKVVPKVADKQEMYRARRDNAMLVVNAANEKNEE